jgi:hypothetical protein
MTWVVRFYIFNKFSHNILNFKLPEVSKYIAWYKVAPLSLLSCSILRRREELYHIASNCGLTDEWRQNYEYTNLFGLNIGACFAILLAHNF